MPPSTFATLSPVSTRWVTILRWVIKPFHCIVIYSAWPSVSG